MSCRKQTSKTSIAIEWRSHFDSSLSSLVSTATRDRAEMGLSGPFTRRLSAANHALYAGFLISEAAAADPDVKALVYVAAYIPQKGESPADLTYLDPGSRLTGTNLVTRTGPDGTDLYVNPDTFGEVYAGGLPKKDIATAAVVQRPIAASALGDAATVNPPASVPKWSVVALDDHAIPTKTQFFMSGRAHAHVVTTHSGHDVPAARAHVVDDVILKAARSVR